MSKVILQFENENQARAFYRWFKDYGFDELCENDAVHDQLSMEEFYSKIKNSSHPAKLTYLINIE